LRCASYVFYIARAKRNESNRPVRIEFADEDALSDSLNIYDYADILTNENHIEEMYRILFRSVGASQKGNRRLCECIQRYICNDGRIQLMSNNNLNQARECCLRENNLWGKSKPCETGCRYMRNIARLWDGFC